MMTFNALLALYDDATPQQRQRVLDMLPEIEPPLTQEHSNLARVMWDTALRAVFEPMGVEA